MVLSIIIPLYNKEKYFEYCLKSTLTQDLPSNEYEIIVINDGSTDSSAEIAKSYASTHSNVHFFSQENIGLSATRNKGLELAKGDFVYFLDADDYLASDILLALTNIAKRNNLDILAFHSSPVSNYTHTASTSIIPNNKSLEVEVMDGISYLGKGNGIVRSEVWWYIINKSFLLDTGIRFVEGRIAQDPSFNAKILSKGNRVTRVNLDVHRFVKVENSIQTITNYKHIIKYTDDMVFAIKEIHFTKNQVDSGNKYYNQAMITFKRKQQAIVFAIFIKVFKCPRYEINRLNKKIEELKRLGVYPLNRKIGGIGSPKTRFVFTNFIVPILNKKPLFILFLRFYRLTMTK